MGRGGSACHSPQPLPAWPWLAVQVPTLQGTTAQAATLWGHPSHKASSHGHHGPGWPCARLLDRAFLAVSLAPLQPRAPRAAGPVTPASLPRARPPPRAAAGHRAGRLWAHSQGLQPARAWPRAAFGGVTHRGRPGPCPYVSGQRHWAHSSLNFPPGNGVTGPGAQGLGPLLLPCPFPPEPADTRSPLGPGGRTRGPAGGLSAAAPPLCPPARQSWAAAWVSSWQTACRLSQAAGRAPAGPALARMPLPARGPQGARAPDTSPQS